MSNGTLLETVAAHESGLMAQVEETKQANRKAIEEAQANAISTLQQLQNKLDQELTDKRHQASFARDNEQQQIESDTERKVKEIRDAAAPKLDAIRDQIVATLLPGNQ